MRSESVRKESSTYTDSICRPPAKPPDKLNSLEGEISKKISPYINQIYRPLPKPPDIPKLSRILLDLLDLEMDLDMNYPHNIRDKPEKLGINWKITISRMHMHNIFNVIKIKIVIVNLVEFL